MARALFVASLACLLAVPAHAQPSLTPPSTSPPAPVSTPPVSGSRKDPGTAVAISAGISAGAAGVLMAAFAREDESLLIVGGVASLFAPATGHWYAGRALNPAMGVRFLAVGLGVAGGAGLDSCGYFNAADDSPDPDCSLAVAATIGAAVVYSVASVYEIVDAGSSARAYNRRHGLEVMVAPTTLPAAGGAAPGVTLTGRF